MKKAIILTFCFMISFITTLYFTLPYAHIYHHLLQKMAIKTHTHLTYKMVAAHAFSLTARDIHLSMNSKPIEIEKVQIKGHPINYLIGKAFLSFYIYEKGHQAVINCQKKGGHFLINGIIPVPLLKNVLKDQPLLGLLKGKIRISLRLKRQKKQINIDQLQIRDAVNIDAKGYLKGSFIALKGIMIYQNIKKKFNYAGRI